MRNELHHIYFSWRISGITSAVLDASCNCAGSASGRCNHLAAVLIKINLDFGQNSKMCKSKPCEWTKGQEINKTPGKVNKAEYEPYKTRGP